MTETEFVEPPYVFCFGQYFIHSVFFFTSQPSDNLTSGAKDLLKY